LFVKDKQNIKTKSNKL